MIPDRAFQKGKTGVPYMQLMSDWINGDWNLTDTRALLWLLSKGEPGVPVTIDKTRPLVFNNMLYKMCDHTFNKVFGSYLWLTVHKSQVGSRKGSRRELACAETLRMVLEQYTVKFIDVQAAYDSVIMEV